MCKDVGVPFRLCPGLGYGRMLHVQHIVNRNPTRADVRTFGLTIFVGLGVIGGLLWWAGSGDATGLAWTHSSLSWMALTLWTLGAGVGIICWSSQSVGRPIYVVWMSAAMYMGMVMVPVFLSVVFILVLPLFSLIRLKDPLRKKLRAEGSYWEPYKPHEATLERMRRPF